MHVRKEALLPGSVFSLLTIFTDSANTFAEISKTRPMGLKQFEIFTLRHLLNFPVKTLDVASKTDSGSRTSLETFHGERISGKDYNGNIF